MLALISECLSTQLGNLFSAHARLLLRHPWPFVIGPCLLTTMLSLGLLELPRALVKDELEMYTPRWEMIDSLFCLLYLDNCVCVGYNDLSPLKSMYNGMVSNQRHKYL